MVRSDLTGDLGANSETMDLDAAVARTRRHVSLIIYDPSGTRIVALREGAPLVIGRVPDAPFGVDDPTISRRHASFEWSSGELWIEDLGSRNGTKVNGRPIQRSMLRPQDEFTMGAITGAVHVTGEAETWIAPRKTDEADTPHIIASASTRALFATVDRVAMFDIPVLIIGETGTGKEVVARALHDRGPRRAGPMACINCAAIPSQLVESTLFGHERGAFTGADQRQQGVFEAGRGGVVFLDEIGELPLAAQAVLLRVLESARITRVGSTREIEIDVRIIAATNRDLEQMCKDGSFREDLYYRLNTMVLKVPPLRDRTGEIEALAMRFLREQSGDHRIEGFSPAALQCLNAHRWPGNVRELRNVVQRAVVVSEGPLIDALDLPERLQKESLGPPEESGSPAPNLDRRATSSPERRVPKPRSESYRVQLKAAEASILLDGLARAGWNQTRAAELLEMPLRTLVHKIKTLSLKSHPDWRG